MKNNGFTLYELLITLAVIAITLAIGIPSFNKTIQNTRAKTATLELLTAVEQARATAVFSNKRTVLFAKTHWHEGWTLFLDANDNGILDNDERVVTEQAPLSAVKIKGNHPVSELISFIGTGEARDPGRANAGAFIAGTIKVCPIAKGEGYKIILSKGGRSRVKDMTEEECTQAQNSA